MDTTDLQCVMFDYHRPCCVYTEMNEFVQKYLYALKVGGVGSSVKEMANSYDKAAYGHTFLVQGKKKMSYIP